MTWEMFNSRVTFQLKHTLSGCVPWTDELGTDVAELRSSQRQQHRGVSDSNGKKWFQQDAWGAKTWRERERKKRVNAWNRWPTDQARSHHHRRRHRHRSVRESLEEAGGGPGYLTRRTRLCKGSHVRRLLTKLSLGRHVVALQPAARASTVCQGLIIKEPN